MSTETTQPDARDILRELVEDCERAYAEDYREAAGESPSPADPQQVADRIVEDTGWSDLAQTYLKARRFLDALTAATTPGSVGELRSLIDTLPDGARVLPDWHGAAPNDAEPAVEIKSLSVRSDGVGKYLSVGVALSYLERRECDECGEEIPDGVSGVNDAHDPSCSLHPDNAVEPGARPQITPGAENSSGR